MKSTLKMSATALVLAAALLAPRGARAEDKSWWLDVEGGIEYDDNVAVDQNDDTSGSGDAAATFEVDAGYKAIDTENSRVEIGYDFYQSVYQDLNEFNYQSHTPSLNAWTKLGGVKLGFNYEYLHSLLDNRFFLDQHTFSPTASAFLTDTIFVSAFYRYHDKNYNSADDARDAQTHQPGADVFLYFDKANKGYVSLGGSYTDEDTDGPAFDYSGFVGRAAVQFPVTLFERKGRVKFSYSYQMRDYDNDESLLLANDNLKRSDDRHTLRAYGDISVTRSLKAIAEARFIERNSNLAAADYRENIASLGLRYGF